MCMYKCSGLIVHVAIAKVSLAGGDQLFISTVNCITRNFSIKMGVAHAFINYETALTQNSFSK